MRRTNALLLVVLALALLTQGAVAGKSTVTHWFSGPHAMYDFVKDQIAGFEKANPDLKIELAFVTSSEWNQKYSVMFATDTPVDVIWTNNNNNLPYYMAHDLLLPMNKYADQVGLDFSDFVQPVVQQATRNGEIFAVPYAALPTPGLFYNADKFDSVGVPHPTDNWHYDSEFLSAAKKLSRDTNGDSRQDQYGLGPQLLASRRGSAYVLLEAFGGRILSLDGTRPTVTEPGTIAGLSFLHSLAHELQVMGGSFWTGSAAMDLDGFWAIPGFTSSLKGANTGVAAVPLGPAGRKVMFVAGYYSIPRTSRNPEGAMRWINYLTSDETSKAWLKAKLNLTGKLRVNSLPEFIQDEMTGKWVSFYGIEGMAPVVPANFRVSDVDQAFDAALGEMAHNKAPVRQVAEQLQQKLEVILSESEN